MRAKTLVMGAVALVAGAAAALPAQAGDNNGDFMVRVLGTVVDPDTNTKSVTANGAAIAGADADVSTQVIPALTLSYFLTNNWALELFCCFSKHDVDGKGSIAGLGEIADTWIFPPVVTLQYHFDGLGAFKPYVGAGVQWIHFFNEGTGANALGATSVDIDDAFGLALQAGVDLALGDGWYLQRRREEGVARYADVTWNNTALGTVQADVDLDPWIISAGVGYRFNIEDLFAARSTPAPLK